MPRKQVRRKRGIAPDKSIASSFGVTLPEAAAERYLSPNDIGQLLGVTGEAVKQWIHKRTLPAIKLSNGYWKIKASDLERFLKSRVELPPRTLLVSGISKAAEDTVERAASKASLGVQIAHSLADAMLKINSIHPVLLLTDVGWDDVWPLIEYTRKSRVVLPTLLLTNNGLSNADLERAVANHVCGVINMPINEDTLSKEFVQALQR